MLATHESTKCFPYFANFGQEMVLSLEEDPEGRLVVLERIREEIRLTIKTLRKFLRLPEPNPGYNTA